MTGTLKRFQRGIILAFFALALVGLALASRPVGPAAAARSFYVSRTGNGADGTSWATAWTQPNQIDWSVVQPGDTIFIDGGPAACPSLGVESNCGMVYNAPLLVGKSGTAGAPITIRLAVEPGRNGTAILDGGVTNFNFCSSAPAQPSPPANGGTVYPDGIRLAGHSYVTIDGGKWGGISVRNFSTRGIDLDDGSFNTLRFLRVHHINSGAGRVVGIASAYPASNLLLEQLEVFWVHQDIFHWEASNSTIRRSYFHNAHCNHADGVQGFVPTGNADVPDTAGRIANLTIEDNIFQRIWSDSASGQYVFVGENVTHDSWVENLTIRGNLFWVDGGGGNAYFIKTKNAKSKNILVENNTFVGPTTRYAIEWCCGGASAPNTIRNNVFYRIAPGSGAFRLDGSGTPTQLQNNCIYNSGTRAGNYSESGTISADPLLANLAGGDFRLLSGSPCASKGARVTSIQQLLSLAGSAISTAVPPTATRTPGPTATRTYAPPTATAVNVLPTNTSAPPTATRTSTPPAPTQTAPPSASTTLTFQPAADGLVDAKHPNRSYGSSTVLRTIISPEQRSYLRFDVQGVAGRAVNRVLLHLYANSASLAGFQVKLVNNDTWTEQNLTYNNKPAVAGIIGTAGPHAQGVWVTVDITSYVQGDGLYSLAITSSSTQLTGYPSGESASNKPYLSLAVGASSRLSATTVPPTATRTSAPPTATRTSVPPTSVPPTSVPSLPATLTFSPAADAVVDAANSGTNYGSTYMLLTYASPEQRSYLRFNVQGIAGRAVNRVLLHIYAYGSSAVGFQVKKVSGDWAESTITYNNKPALAEVIGAAAPHSYSAWVTVDITPYIQADGTYNMAMVTGSTKLVGYPSRDNATNQPYLTVEVGGQNHNAIEALWKLYFPMTSRP